MNNQEAIENLKSQIISCDSVKLMLDSSRNKMDEEFNYEFYEDNLKDTESLKLAIQALEKQISKKPKENYNWCDLSNNERKENSQWFCGECGRPIGEEFAFCSDCGQRLDWGEL